MSERDIDPEAWDALIYPLALFQPPISYSKEAFSDRSTEVRQVLFP